MSLVTVAFAPVISMVAGVAETGVVASTVIVPLIRDRLSSALPKTYAPGSPCAVTALILAELLP